MAVICCKMCGGELEIAEGALIAKCRYCGTKQTVPKLDSEKKVTLFSRANRLRFNSEFDKASGVYESIVAEFPEEAEAYWGLVLCKYGIEYVDDPATANKVATCHRTSFTSVFEDTDFEQTLENADPATRAVYRDEAKKIEELRQGIVEVSSKEEPYDIFICYKETDANGNRTIDSVIAQDVYTALTDKGYRVFFSRISLEDKLGTVYEPYIFAALNSAKIMLAFGTDYEYYNAVWVKNEWSRFIKLMATDRSKTLIPCYKGIDAYDMPKEFLKLQSQDMGKVGALQDLLRGIEKILPKKKPEIKTEVKTVEKVVVKGKNGVDTGSLLRRAEMFLEDGDFKNANSYAEKVLDIDPENAEAYLIKLCHDLKVKTRSNLGKLKEKFTENPNCKKALRFADDSLKEELDGYLAQVKNNELTAQNEAEIKRRKYAVASKMIAVGFGHYIASKADGTVVAVGNNYSGQCNVSEWRNIVAVDANDNHSVGLKDDGTVVAVGNNDYGQCIVSGWRDIVAISAGYKHTVGLKKDGTVVAVGDNDDRQCNVSGWIDIVAVSAGANHTVGLKKDGTVVAVGDNEYGQCNVSEWRGIVAVSTWSRHTAGLKKDGTVVVVGRIAQSKASEWRDIIAITAGNGYTVGLKSDGTVVTDAANYIIQNGVSAWRDIVAISTYQIHTIGLKSDGTVVAVGDSGYGHDNIGRWKLFKSIETLEKEKEDLKRKAEKAQRQAEEKRRLEAEAKRNALNTEKTDLQTELANLKGIFSRKRRKEIETRIAQIDNQLRNI